MRGMSPTFPHAETFYRPVGGRTSPETGVVTQLLRAGVPVDLPAAVEGDPLVVRVDHGRWLVECPVCGEAQYAGRHDRRFLCITCYRSGEWRAWRAVEWPTDDEIDVAERLLRARAVRARNWRPDREPIEHLARENAVRGLTLAGVSVPEHVRELRRQRRRERG